MVRGSGRSRLTARSTLALAVLATQALALAIGAAPVNAAPGSPRTPRAPVLNFSEDFQNNIGSTPVPLLSYTGVTGETYTADPAWLTNCNGEVVTFNMTTLPANCAAGTQGMTNLRSLAYALGALRNSADPAANGALSAYTDLGNNTAVDPGAPKVQFETVQPLSLPAGGKRYITFSVDVAALECGRAHPLLEFTLLSDGQAFPVFGEIDACTDPRGRDITVPDPTGGTKVVHVGTYSPAGSIAFNGTSLRVRMVNNQGLGLGNDAAIDNLEVLDATPQLDKVFEPATQVAGQPATLTFTVTNTAELSSKLGWSFSDTLPAGMTVVAPTATTTCTNGVVTAPVGGTTISVTGDLETNQAFCTVTVNVTAPAGHYENSATNVTTDGINPPGTTPIDFVPVLGLDKTGTLNDLNANGRADAGDTVDYAFTVTNPQSNGVDLSTVAVVDDKVGPVSCPVTTLAPGESTTCTAIYTLTQADVDAGAVDNTATATATPPSGPAITSPPASASVPIPPHPGLTLDKTAGAVVDANGTGMTDAGDSVTYSFQVTNTGNVTLTGVAVDDPLLAAAGIAITCPAEPLPPGQSTTCHSTAPYVITADDVAAGAVHNTATATATDPHGGTVGPAMDSVNIPTATLPRSGPELRPLVAVGVLLLLCGALLLAVPRALAAGRARRKTSPVLR